MSNTVTAIVTDSTADIPPEILTRLNISSVPAIIIINGKDYEDGKGISRNVFYERLPGYSPLPTTSTPSINAFREVYKSLFLSGYRNIISIHVSSLLSGIYNTAHTAAKFFGDQVKVVDSEQISLGLGFQVISAAQSAQKGISVKDILSQLAELRTRIKVYAMLDTLEFLRKSGRVSWAQARIGSMLKIKPLIELRKGIVINAGQSRTRKKGISNLKSTLLKLGPIEKLAVMHSNAETDAFDFVAAFPNAGSLSPIVVNVTTIIGTHVGPNGLGFAAVLKNSD